MVSIEGVRTIGSTSDWFPSRKSVDSHRGGLSMVLEGHDLSGRFNGWNFRYLVEGSLSIGIMTSGGEKKRRGGERRGKQVGILK